MRGGCAGDGAGPVDVHLYPDVITVPCPGNLNLAVPVADRCEEEIYFGFGVGSDANLTRGVWIARRRNDQLAGIVENFLSQALGEAYAEIAGDAPLASNKTGG